VLNVLPIGPTVRGLKPIEDERIFKTIKIRSTNSFRGEAKPSVPCRQIIRYVEKPIEV
jgi:hypothetical protein